MPHYCGQPPEKRRQFTREYFRSSPLGSSPSRVASLLLLQSRMPPALVVEQVFHSASAWSRRSGRFSDEPFRVRDVQFDCPAILVEPCPPGEEIGDFRGTRR